MTTSERLTSRRCATVRPKKPALEKVMMAWAAEWAKEGVAVDCQTLMPPEGFLVLPRTWLVERTLSRIDDEAARQ